MPIPQNIVSLKDLEALCLTRFDPMVADYLYDGAEEGHSIKENLDVWGRYLVRPRMFQGTHIVDLENIKPFLGRKWKFPVGIAPSAMQQLAHHHGEKATAAGAKACGVPLGLSTFSNYSLEDVKEAGGESVGMLQVYLLKHRNLNIEMLQRAKAAGYKAIVVTVDAQIGGNRPALIKGAFALPAHMNLANFPSDVKIQGPLELQVEKGSTSGEAQPPGKKDLEGVPWLAMDDSTCWERDIPFLKANTDLEIWVKGILDPRDAEEAIKYGCDGIWVSNHGGRQIDCEISALDALPAIVEAVAGRVPIHVDGGVRRGGDVFRALALGADFVWIGRPVWWGLKLDGVDGVQWVINTLEKEFKNIMQLMGCKNVSEIRRDMLVTRSDLPSNGGRLKSHF